MGTSRLPEGRPIEPSTYRRFSIIELLLSHGIELLSLTNKFVSSQNDFFCLAKKAEVRQKVTTHTKHSDWLSETLRSPGFGLCNPHLCFSLRIVTNSKARKSNQPILTFVS